MIAMRLCIPEHEVLSQIASVREMLRSALQKHVETYLQRDLSEYNFIPTRLTVFVETWLQKEDLQTHILDPPHFNQPPEP
jgi:hypothetical protein